MCSNTTTHKLSEQERGRVSMESYKKKSFNFEPFPTLKNHVRTFLKIHHNTTMLYRLIIGVTRLRLSQERIENRQYIIDNWRTAFGLEIFKNSNISKTIWNFCFLQTFAGWVWAPNWKYKVVNNLSRIIIISAEGKKLFKIWPTTNQTIL